ERKAFGWQRALIDEGIAGRVRLGRRGLLARLLVDRFFVDADEWLAIASIEQIAPAGLGALEQALARLTVVGLIEHPRRARRVEVPDVGVDLLEVPLVLAGLVVEGDDRAGEQVVALA